MRLHRQLHLAADPLDLLVVLCAAVWLGGCGTGEAVRGRSGGPPHLVVVSIDTLNRQALPAYSVAAAGLPAFERLASECLVYDSAFTVAPWTLPSHASLFTGLYPRRHGAIDKDSAISSDTVLAAEVLTERGYQTGAFTGGGFVSPHYGFDRGFERYEVAGEELQELEGPDDGSAGSVQVPRPFEAAEAFLRDRVDRRPLFLFLHTYSVHDYYLACDAARSRAGLDLPEYPGFVPCMRGERQCSELEWSQLEKLYRAEVELVDLRLESVLRTIEAELDDRPVNLFLISDHGEGFAPQERRIHHGGRLDPELVHVPMFACGDPFETGRSSEVVSLIDLQPTLLGLAGAPLPEVDGRPLMEGRSGRRRVAAEERRHRWEDGRRLDFDGGDGEGQLAAVIDGLYWFVQHRVDEPDLYRREGADGWSPAAVRQVPGGFRSIAESLMSSVVRREPARLDPELEEQLRSLGYVD